MARGGRGGRTLRAPPRVPRLRAEGGDTNPHAKGGGKEGSAPTLHTWQAGASGRGGAHTGGGTQQEGEGVCKLCLHTPSPTCTPVHMQTRTQRGEGADSRWKSVAVMCYVSTGRQCYDFTNNPSHGRAYMAEGCLVSLGSDWLIVVSQALLLLLLHTSPCIVPVRRIVLSHVSRASEWPLSRYLAIMLSPLSTAS